MTTIPDNNIQPGVFFPNLETERLILRQLTLDDMDFIFHQFSDPRVCQYLMDEPAFTGEEEARSLIKFFQEPDGKNHNRWGIVRKSDRRLIGTCGFHHWQKAYYRAEIGYDLTPDCWQQGYISEALGVALENGFERMGLNRIEALVHPDNQGSIRTLQKFGFKQEGVLRDYFCLDGIFYDHFIFSLLRREWK